MKNSSSYLVGITGGSASGKTHVLKQLGDRFGSKELTIISLDNYYYDLADQPRDAQGQVNFDHPSAMNMGLFREHLDALLQGQAVEIREYFHNNPQGSSPNLIRYEPAPILIVEGLFVFYVPEAEHLFDLRIFVDAEEHIKLIRRIRRDVSDRGYPIEEVMEMYQQFVMPMYRQFIEPFKHQADLVIPSNHAIDKAVEVVIDHLARVLERIEL